MPRLQTLNIGTPALRVLPCCVWRCALIASQQLPIWPMGFFPKKNESTQKISPHSPKRPKDSDEYSGDELELMEKSTHLQQNTYALESNNTETSLGIGERPVLQPTANLQSSDVEDISKMHLRSSSTVSSDFEKTDVIEQKTQVWNIADWFALLNETAEDSSAESSASFTCPETTVEQQKAFGPEMTIGGARWRILMFPHGNDKKEFVSIFLKFCGFTDEEQKSEQQPARYSVCASFRITLLPENFPETATDTTVTNSAHHRFNVDSNDWGFSYFAPGETMAKLARLADGSLLVKTVVTVVRDSSGMLWVDSALWNSKKETGFIGIRNQGATCYMNSLLQSLFFTNSFRRLIYQLPTERDTPGQSLLLALQRIFFQLQTFETHADTTELTKSFGWGLMESVEHHDVQEFLKKLQDSVERKLKEAKIADPFEKVFGGRLSSIIKCIHVPYTSKNVETFHEVLLPIHDGSMIEALRKYTEFETIAGENGLVVDGHGKQDIVKGVMFQRLPPVIHFQLLRFVFDFNYEMTVKLNDRFEFPASIDMSPFVDPESLSSDDCYIYNLHGVLVHCGESNVGHYYAFIKPTQSSGWFKFDDEKVTPASDAEAIDDNFGFNAASRSDTSTGVRSKFAKKFTNAYMLVYIKQSEYASILAPIDSNELPAHLFSQFEAQKKLEKEKKQAKLDDLNTIKIRLITDENVRNHSGIGFCSFDKSSSNYQLIRLPKDSATPAHIAKDVSDRLGVAFDAVRLWEIANSRVNGFVLKDAPLSRDEYSVPFTKECVYQFEKKFFVQIVSDPQAAVPALCESQQIVFVKCFYADYETSQNFLEIAGWIDVSLDKCLRDYAADILDLELVQGVFQQPASLDGFEFFVEKNSICTPIESMDVSLRSAGVDFSGACLVIKQPLQIVEADYYDVGDLGSFMYFLSSKKMFKCVSVAQRPNTDDCIELCVSYFSSYDRMASILAKNLGTEPNRIRFYQENEFEELHWVRRANYQTVASIVSSVEGENTQIIYYELLADVTVDELERLVQINAPIFVTPAGVQIKIAQDFLCEPEDTFETLSRRILQNHADSIAKFLSCDSPRFVYYELASAHLIERHFAEADTVTAFQDDGDGVLFFEELRFDVNVPACHFFKFSGNHHSMPFFAGLAANWTLTEAREHLCARFAVTEKDAAAAKVHFVLRDKKSIVVAAGDEEEEAAVTVEAIAPTLELVAFEHAPPKEPYRPQKSMIIK